MGTSYKYFAFGLFITSDIQFSELILSRHLESVDNTPRNTIKIELGTTPDCLVGKDVTNLVKNWARPNEFLLEIIDVAKYHIINGEKIIVEPIGHVKWKEIKLFLLETAMKYLLQQRQNVIFRASAIRYKHGVVMFCGHTGVGKSTLVANLNQCGYQIFSDDNCIVQPNQEKHNEALITSSYPILRLWQDSIDFLSDQELFNNKRPIRDGFKYYENLIGNDFTPTSLPVLKIYILKISNHSKSLFKEDVNSGFRKLKLLGQYICQDTYLSNISGKKNVLQILSRLSSQVPMTLITRPSKWLDFQGFINTVKSEL